MAEKDPNIIKLPEVRLSFPCLWTAKAMEEGKEPQFGATFLLDNQTHGRLLDDIDKAIDRVALDFFKKKVSLKHRCLRDGNEKSELEGYGDGTSFLVASNKLRPGVVDRRLVTVTEQDNLIYAGCYVNATIRLFAWEHKTGGRGVSAQLRAVQFVRDGDAFGAGPVDPTQEFEALEQANEELANGSRSRSKPGATSGRKASNLDDY